MRMRDFATVTFAARIVCTPAPAQEVGREATPPSLTATLPLDPVNAGASARIERRRGPVRGNRTNAYWLADVKRGTGRPVRGLEATPSMKNLLDKRYALPGRSHRVQDAIPLVGRVLSLELSLLP